MSEIVSILTVPDRWNDDAPANLAGGCQTVVGCVDFEGQEWRISHNPHDYLWGSAGYSRGYNPNEVSRAEINLGPMAARVITFVRDKLIRQRWARDGHPHEHYDCSFLGFGITGQLPEGWDTDIAIPTQMAQEVVDNGYKISRALGLGELGVLGAHLDTPTGKGAEAYHTVVGWGDDRVIQVNSVQGRVIICPKDIVLWRHSFNDDTYQVADSYGIYVSV